MKSVFKVAGLAAALLLTCACSVSVGTSGEAKSTPAEAKSTPAAAANAANPPAANAAAPDARPASAEADGKQDFTLINTTGVEINKLFISPHETNDWEEDILGRDTLPSGQAVNVKFHRDEQAPMWDLKVEDSEGNSIVWENLNLLAISKVTLHYENGRAWAETE